MEKTESKELELKDYRNKFKDFINDKTVDKLRLGLKDPNIFQILGIAGHEIRHSNFLAWLLDPNEGHGLGSIFIQKILREIFIEKEIIIENKPLESEVKYPELMADDINYNKVQIFREWKNISSKKLDSIDILIKYEEEFIIAIENKFWSGEGEKQLSRYQEMVRECFPKEKTKHRFFAYLTPEGMDASENEWVSLSYSSIVEFLKDIIELLDDSLSVHVKQYINDYLVILNREVMGEDKLVNYAKSIYKDHKQLFDFIERHGKSSALRDAATTFCEKNEYILLSQRGNKWMYFVPKNWINTLIFKEHEKYLENSKYYPIMFALEHFRNSKGNDVIKVLIQVQPYKIGYEEKRKELITCIKEKAQLKIKSENSKRHTAVYTMQEEVTENEEEILELLKNFKEGYQKEGHQKEGYKKIANDIFEVLKSE
ncbi:PD-(D/E)XK nuclease family protein [Olivibacter sitiensis]|uniref:PDDEXK-like family protein n=1 Tax=Olivibacter sitiensis TaxID=376470 RepID=UPI0004112903|nr:PD-(D/E)XK nuclease family protein [Olivibacter sitiensis]